MNYTLSFKNGHKMNVAVDNGKELILAITKGLKEHPERPTQFAAVDSILINVSEITAVHPEHMETKPATP